MNKKKIVIILLVYILTLAICIALGYLDTERFMDNYMEKMDYGNPAVLLGPMIIMVSIHIFITTIIAIYVKFNKKIENKYKTIFYLLPIITFAFWMPFGVVVARIVDVFTL